MEPITLQTRIKFPSKGYRMEWLQQFPEPGLLFLQDFKSFWVDLSSQVKPLQSHSTNTDDLFKNLKNKGNPK